MRSSPQLSAGQKSGAMTDIHLHSVLRAQEDLGDDKLPNGISLKSQFDTRHTSD
jgi:hypothetical protein